MAAVAAEAGRASDPDWPLHPWPMPTDVADATEAQRLDFPKRELPKRLKTLLRWPCDTLWATDGSPPSDAQRASCDAQRTSLSLITWVAGAAWVAGLSAAEASAALPGSIPSAEGEGGGEGGKWGTGPSVKGGSPGGNGGKL